MAVRTLFAAAVAALVMGAVIGTQVWGQQAVNVAVDVDTSGNSATSLGSRQDCNTVDIGETLDVDVTVDSVPKWTDANGNGVLDRGVDPGGVTAFQFLLHYDPKVLKVSAVDNQMLIAANGNTVPVEFSETPPDSRDDPDAFLVAFLDFGFSPPESGSGVLSRITLTAVGQGRSELQLSDVALTEATEQGYSLYVSGAAVAVGQACNPPPGTPVFVPGTEADGTPAPGETPSSDGGTPSPGGGTPSPGSGLTTPAGGTSGPGGGQTTGESGGGGVSTAGWIAIGIGLGAALAAVGAAGWLARRRAGSP
ncbi:MAG: hypothetical protein HYY03_05755 [Chloroflexi bacterium]|nr:hypothetical protein [Chloroflexota bacterium]